MMPAISVDRVWRETLAQTREHLPAFSTITAAFIFLPALAFGLMFAGEMAAMSALQPGVPPPELPALFWMLLFVTFLLNSVATLTIVNIVGDPRRPGDELVGETMRRMVPPVLRYLGGLIVVGVVIGAVLAVLSLLTTIVALPLALLFGVASTEPTAAGTLIGILFAAIVLPLLFWIIARFFALPAIYAVERAGVFAGVRRAWRLSRGSGWRLLLLFLVFLLAGVAVSLVAQGLAAAVGATTTVAGAKSVGAVLFATVNAVAGAALALLFNTALGVIYRFLADAEPAPA